MADLKAGISGVQISYALALRNAQEKVEENSSRSLILKLS